MKAVIIDDDASSCELLAEYITRSGLMEIAGTFSSPSEALLFLASNRSDVIFLDIELPGISGLELIGALANPEQKIILVSGHSEFALEAFEHHVSDYLLKPVSYQRFLKAVMAVVSESKNRIATENDDIVFVKKDKMMVRLRMSEVLSAEARGDYVIIHTARENHIVHCTLKALEEKLPEQAYIRVHRSWLVRIDGIEKIEDQTITSHSRTIPIGRSYREEVFSRIHSL